MNVLGVDLNSTRLRAVCAPAGAFPILLPLSPPHAEFPLAISLEGRAPEAGPAGLRLCRRLPHLACFGFLPHLGEPELSARKWVARRYSLTSEQAVGVVLQRLQPVWFTASAAVLSLPAYLTLDQIELLLAIAEQVRLPLLGSVTAPLAAALAAHAERPWFGTAVVVDADDHALSLGVVSAAEGQAHLVDTWSLPQLGVRAWKERLLNALADACVLQSRRDPRDAPMAEQALYEQLDDLFEACRQRRMASLAFQTPTWYQNLVLRPDQPVSYCAPLVQQAIAEIEAILGSTWPDGPPVVVVLTAAAARLPGLSAALEMRLDEMAQPTDDQGMRATLPLTEDFGEGLLEDEPGASLGLFILSADAPARAAHALAMPFQRGDWPCGHLDQAAPLPLPQPVEAGPARLHYRGQDYLLTRVAFSLGRQPGCDLVFDGEDGQTVASRHCEIRLEHRQYHLCNHSRDGTLINDRPVNDPAPLRPGDWIRLGPSGPLLRFLGQPADLRGRQTTA
jgi:hypothetical protein